MTPPLLKCPDCPKPTPPTEFFRNRSRASGFEGYCKVHATARHTQKPSYRKRHNLWATLNRLKVNAHNAVKRALENGALVKPAHCQNCGGGTKLNAHHDDYSKPLVVRWLCTHCHYTVHHPQGAIA